jgi:hypothetical protein
MATFDCIKNYEFEISNEPQEERTKTMTEYYDIKKDEDERHDNSIKAANEVAKEAEKVAFEKQISYEEAAAYVRKMNPRTAEMEAKGYISEEPARMFSKSSLDAAAELASRAKKYMRENKVEYEEAVKIVLRNDQDLADAYAFAD